MTLNHIDRIERLVEKHNVIGVQGKGIKEINVNEPSGLNTYVAGTILRTYWSQPDSNLIEPISHTEEEKVLKLTKQGEKFLKNNINNIIDEYKQFTGHIEENNQNNHPEEDINLNSTTDFLKKRKTEYRINDLKESYDIVGNNGSAKIVKKSQNITPILAQNAFGSTSNNLSDDLIYPKYSKNVDEQIVGSRNEIRGEKVKLAYKR